MPPSIAVYRSVRVGGDTKTRKSRRRLALPQRCVDALRRHHGRLPQPPARDALVFATSTGTAPDAHNVRRAFRQVVAAAGLDAQEWTPRELRHSFVSLLSASGVRIEDIARLVGHSATGVIERVYRHQLHAVLDEGTTAMDDIFPLGDARWSLSPPARSFRASEADQVSPGRDRERATFPLIERETGGSPTRKNRPSDRRDDRIEPATP